MWRYMCTSGRLKVHAVPDTFSLAPVFARGESEIGRKSDGKSKKVGSGDHLHDRLDWTPIYVQVEHICSLKGKHVRVVCFLLSSLRLREGARSTSLTRNSRSTGIPSSEAPALFRFPFSGRFITTLPTWDTWWHVYVHETFLTSRLSSQGCSNPLRLTGLVMGFAGCPRVRPLTGSAEPGRLQTEDTIRTSCERTRGWFLDRWSTATEYLRKQVRKHSSIIPNPRCVHGIPPTRTALGRRP